MSSGEMKREGRKEGLKKKIRGGKEEAQRATICLEQWHQESHRPHLASYSTPAFLELHLLQVGHMTLLVVCVCSHEILS